MPLLKCFHADHHYYFSLWFISLVSATKPKTTGREKCTINGLSLPNPSRHIIVLISHRYLQKGVLWKILTLGEGSVSVPHKGDTSSGKALC